MITTPTVFILGAGASYPYGFPLGAGLRRDLCNHRDESNGWFIDALTAAGFDPSRVRTFLHTFLGSGQRSIDRFLGMQPELREVGKAAIATGLILCENPATVHNPANQEDWYVALWTAMTTGASRPSDLAGNTVAFLTFNYDRSLEYFFHQATKHTFPDTSDEEAMRFWMRIPILHAYGVLGDFHYEARPGCRIYGPALTADAINTAAKKLKVMPEYSASDGVFDKATEWFNGAERICFLGFGFDALNMQRLGLNDVVKSRMGKPGNRLEFFASTVGMYQPEKKAARNGVAYNHNNFTTSDKTNLDALREFGFLS